MWFAAPSVRAQDARQRDTSPQLAVSRLAAHHDRFEVDTVEMHYCQTLTLADELSLAPSRPTALDLGELLPADGQARAGSSTPSPPRRRCTARSSPASAR
jgi:hypothetical protein